MPIPQVGGTFIFIHMASTVTELAGVASVSSATVSLKPIMPSAASELGEPTSIRNVH